MGKAWDNGEVAFDPAFWYECLRVLRPGGYLLSFGGSRTYHRMACAIEDAGFEIRDCINWVYGSGFPKSLSIDKAFDKDNEAEREVICRNPNDREQNSSIDFNGKGNGWISAPASDEAKQWNGWGTALKPAHEPIVMARKPLAGRVIDNIRAWGVGGINVDKCRIATSEVAQKVDTTRPYDSKGIYSDWPGAKQDYNGSGATSPAGRFPSNLILSHSPNCVKVGRKKIKPLEGHRPNPVNVQSDGNIQFNCKEPGFQKVSYTDASGHETIDDYVCAEDCPIRLMSAQSGILKSGKLNADVQRGSFGQNGIYGKSERDGDGKDYPASAGSAARFFLNIDPEPFFYCAKASRSEREHGLGEMPAKEAQKNGGGARLGRDTSLDKRLSENGTERILLKNFHPTVKPLKLMRYLCRLITPPRGLILDPFAGSGTTLCAAKLEGFDATGIELNQEYITIAEARLAAYSDLHKPLTSFS